MCVCVYMRVRAAFCRDLYVDHKMNDFSHMYVYVCIKMNKFLSPLYNSEIQSEEDLDTSLTPTSFIPTSLTPTPRGGQRAGHVTTLATGVCMCVCVCSSV